MYSLETVNENDIVYETSPGLLERSIFLSFTTRKTGVSKQPFDSLNLAFHVGDEPQDVIKNRMAISSNFGIVASKLTCAQQLHGVKAHLVRAKDIGAGSQDLKSAIENTDALITDMVDVPLALFFADCLPVVLVGLEPRIIAVVHAGYKGLLNGVINKTIKKLANRITTEKLYAFLGPSINSCCYQVDKARIELFANLQPSVVNKGDHFLDLKRIATAQLQKVGLPKNNIISSKYCTSCNPELFFSYRRSNETGRQAAIVLIKER